MENRRRIHEFYDRELQGIEWIDLPPAIPYDCTTSYYFYHIQIKNGKRDELATYLRNRQIYTTYRYFPLHRVKGYGVTGDFPNADYATDNTLCLPIHQTITEDDAGTVVDAIKKFGAGK